MSTRGDIIRGAGGHLKRNTSLGVDIGPPHGGEEGDIRVNMVNNQPRLYARAGNQWYSSILYKNPIDNIFEDSPRNIKGLNLELEGDTALTLTSNASKIIFAGGDGSIAIGNAQTLSSLDPEAALVTYNLNNVAIGADALKLGTQAQQNVAIGSGAMKNVGLHSDDGVNDCARNTAVGFGALQGKEAGRPQAYENVSIGYGSMAGANTTSDASTITCKWNVAMGVTAGYSIEGQYNTCIGAGSSFGFDSITSGSQNTLLGGLTKTSASDGSNQIAIGYQAVGKGNNTAVIGNDYVTAVYMSGDQGASVWLEHINMLERSSDPTEPTEGHAVVWMSDGTGKGADGDIMIASQAGGATKYGTIFDHSGGSSW
jgi:hypothetical protein